MLNIHELERTWLRYKIRRSLPVIAAGIAFVSLSVTGYWFYSDKEQNRAVTSQIPDSSMTDKETSTVKIEPTEVVTRSETIPVSSVIEPVSTPTKPKTIEPATQLRASKKLDETSVAVIKPSMGFLETFERAEKSTPHRPTISRPRPQKTPVLTERPTQKPIAVEKKKDIVEVPSPRHSAQVAPVPTPSTISIIARQDEDDIKDVIKRFKKNKNPALSLFIAKRYYELGRYQKAYNYALITNDINSEIEESWLIFARSLVKLDQKEMALKALSSYIQESDSARAKILLDDISNGGFR